MLAFRSFELLSWSPRNNISRCNFLLSSCSWFRNGPNMGAAFYMSPAIRNWDGRQSYYRTNLCRRKCSSFYSRCSRHVLANVGCLRNLLVSKRFFVLFPPTNYKFLIKGRFCQSHCVEDWTFPGMATTARVRSYSCSPSATRNIFLSGFV